MLPNSFCHCRIVLRGIYLLTVTLITTGSESCTLLESLSYEHLTEEMLCLKF